MDLKNRLSSYWTKIKERAEKSFREEHTPAETAASFSLGAFIVLFPTLGSGLLIFAALCLMTERINRVALFSTAVVFNPAVKMLFYLGSYAVGGLLLGTSMIPSGNILALSGAFNLSLSLVLGSFVVASLTGMVSYAAVYSLSRRFYTG